MESGRRALQQGSSQRFGDAPFAVNAVSLMKFVGNQRDRLRPVAVGRVPRPRAAATVPPRAGAFVPNEPPGLPLSQIRPYGGADCRTGLVGGGSATR